MSLLFTLIGEIWSLLKGAPAILIAVGAILLTVLSQTSYRKLYVKVASLLKLLGFKNITIISHVFTAGLYLFVIATCVKTAYSFLPINPETAHFTKALDCINNIALLKTCNADNLNFCVLTYTSESGASNSDNFKKLQEIVQQERVSDRCNQQPLPAVNDERAWTGAQQTNTVEAYENYLNVVPSGAHVADVKRRIADLKAAEAKALAAANDERVWTAAQQTNTVEAYENYLNVVPSGAHAVDAKKGIADLKAAETKALAAANDERAWTAAQLIDSVEAYENYLNAFVSGAHMHDARKRITDLKAIKCFSFNGQPECAKPIIDTNYGGIAGRTIVFIYQNKTCTSGPLATRQVSQPTSIFGRIYIGRNGKAYFFYTTPEDAGISVRINHGVEAVFTPRELSSTVAGQKMTETHRVPVTASARINGSDVVFSYSWEFRSHWPSGDSLLDRRTDNLHIKLLSETKCTLLERSFRHFQTTNGKIDEDYQCGPAVVTQVCTVD